MFPLDQIKSLGRSQLVRASAVLVGGSAAAQLVTVSAMPILTRLYTPTDFSLLAVFAGIVAIISSAACLRLDIAIPIPEDESAATDLLVLALTFAASISVVGALLALWIPDQISNMLGQPSLAPFFIYVPLATFLAASYSSFQFYFIRRRAFRTIAINRMLQAGAGVGTQVGWGFLQSTPFGLILGQTINSGLGCLRLFTIAWFGGVFSDIRPSRLKKTLHEFIRFPKYSTADALANSASIHLPIVLIASLNIGADAGYLMLAMYTMQAPLGLIGNSIAQAYMSHAPASARAGQLDSLTASVWLGLTKIGAGPLIFAGIVAPQVFHIIFGNEWHRAGELVSWLAPWFILQLLTVPTANALHVQGLMRTALALQLFGLLARLSSVYIAWAWLGGYVAEAYAISGAIFYGVYLIAIARASMIKLTNIKPIFSTFLQMAALWAVFGGITALTVRFLVALP